MSAATPSTTGAPRVTPGTRAWTAPAAAVIALAAATAAMSSFAGADPARAAVALLTVYVLGYVPGALFVTARAEPLAAAWAVVRVFAGLLLTTLAFLASLVFGLPWFTGPAVALMAPVARRGAAAFVLPSGAGPAKAGHSVGPVSPARAGHLLPRLPASVDVVLALAIATVLVSPIVVSAARMAPGAFAPVYFNVDTAYFMEQVQSLARTRVYPPESLSNLGGGRSYHFATPGMAALVARTSGLRPHHATFVIVLPLLAAGLVAAAFLTARTLAPALPLVAGVPLLLLIVPSFWYGFSGELGPRLWTWLVDGEAAAVRDALEGYEFWGTASIVGQNVGAHLLVLASLAAIAAAPARGWRLAVFLVGTGIMIKVSAGVALLAAFLLAEGWQALAARRLRPSAPAAAVLAVFGLTYAAFFVLPRVPPDFATELYPFFHLQWVAARDGSTGLAADIAWILLPALIVMLAARRTERRMPPLLLYGIAPIVVVNLTRSIDMRPGGGGATDDWLQILLPVPILLHAFVLSAAGARWERIGTATRAVVLAVMALSVLPPAIVAARYARLLVVDPASGHEFVDNRAIAEALTAIPVDGTLIVTNDLRYPAQRFNRDNRQMQIPALFGHQAFAVNYAYEVYGFSRARRELQALLQQDAWTPAIDAAAREHGWTHLLVHKPYAHPTPVPHDRIFENGIYAVYRLR